VPTTHDLNLSWARFLRLPFPDGIAGVEIDGVELAELDGAAAGCVSTFHADGELDARREDILRQCQAELRQALPSLQGPAQAYFSELLLLVDAVLAALGPAGSDTK